MSNLDIERKTILFVAPFQSKFQISMFEALQSFGWNMEVFNYNHYTQNNIWANIQAAYLFGPIINRINETLVEKCASIKPDVVFIYKGIYFSSKTMIRIRSFSNLIVSYNPDNPFGNFSVKYAKKYIDKRNLLLSILVAIKRSISFTRLWRNYIKTISFYDINFVPRKSQVSEYKKVGAKDVHFLHWHYIPTLHRPVELTTDDKRNYESDVVLIGRFEPDGRRECIESLLDVGVHVRVFGTGWKHNLSRKMKKILGKSIKPIYGEDYAKALCASKIALNFQAKLNKDTSTIRCFEIPACCTLLLSERTDEMKEIFKEDKEAVYFSNSEELISKVQYLLNNPQKRTDIAFSGYKRCISEGYDVFSRMSYVSDVIMDKLTTEFNYR